LTPAIWLDAADSSTITIASGVSQWNDKSGNGQDFTQATAGKRPTYDSGIRNGLNAVRINNTTVRQLLERTSFAYTGNTMQMFSAYRNLSASGVTRYGRLFGFAPAAGNDYDNNNGILLSANDTSTGIWLYRNSAAIINMVVPNDTWGIIDARRTASTARMALNGGAYSTGTTAAANQNIARARVGNDWAEADSGMNGWIGENLLFTSTLSDADCQKVVGYLAWKWGLQANLPVDHPFKLRAPILGD
jgi:hypothetical protein